MIDLCSEDEEETHTLSLPLGATELTNSLPTPAQPSDKPSSRSNRVESEEFDVARPEDFSPNFDADLEADSSQLGEAAVGEKLDFSHTVDGEPMSTSADKPVNGEREKTDRPHSPLIPTTDEALRFSSDDDLVGVTPRRSARSQRKDSGGIPATSGEKGKTPSSQSEGML